MKVRILNNIEVFKGSLQSFLSSEDILNIFSNIDTILHCNEALLHQLSHTNRIGNVFVQMAPFFKIYSQYVNNYQVQVNKNDFPRNRWPQLKNMHIIINFKRLSRSNEFFNF